MSTTAFRYHTETINGVELQKPVPKRLHAIIMRRIMAALMEQTNGTAFEVYPELDVLCGTDRYCPDILVVRSDAKFTDDMLDDGAFLAVEVMSPGQTIGRLFDKCETYVQNGTKYGWIVWPKRGQSWVVTNGKIEERSPERGESLSAEREATALTLEVPLEELFANLP